MAPDPSAAAPVVRTQHRLRDHRSPGGVSAHPLGGDPLPPGPAGHPVWGSTVDFQKDQLGFCQALQRDFGDVAHFRVAFHDWVQLTDPEHVLDVLVNQASLFLKPSINKKIFEPFLGLGLLSIDGDLWKRHHKLVLPGFHRKRIEAYGDTMVRLTVEQLEGWRPGATVDVCDEMTDITLGIVAKTLFDADVRRDARKVGSAMKVINEALVAHVNLPVPVPRWWPSTANRAKHAALEDFHHTVESVIADRRRSGEDRGDLLSMLIFARTEAGDGLTDRELRDEAMTLFFAGHETTSHALTWMWYLLGRHPEVEQRLAEELATVLEGRLPTVADLDRLPYLEMVVKESMRLLPSVWTYMREPATDVRIGRYRVKKGTFLFIPPYVIHRDARWYPEPLAFRPERFTRENERLLPRAAYVPFSMGPRVCLGKQFALMEARLILATTLQRFRPVLVAGYEPVYKPELSLHPGNGMPTVVTPRASAPHQPQQPEGTSP